MRKIFTLTALGCMLAGTAMAAPMKVEKNSILNQDRNAERVMTSKDGRTIKPRKNAPAREREVTDVIFNAPGEEKLMSKNCAGWYVYFIYLMEYETVDGLAMVSYGDNNDIYFKDILSETGLGTYVKGELDGDIINMSLPQTVYYYDSYGYGLNICVVKMDSYEEDGVTYLDAIPQTDITNITFTIDPADGGISLNLPGEPDEYALGLVYTDDSTWAGYCDYYQEYMPSDVEFYSMPDNVQAEQYQLIADNYGYPVEVAIDGDYMYFKGLCDYFPNAVIRGDYNASTGIVSIPQDQAIDIYGGMYLIITKVIFPDPAEQLVLGPETMTYDLKVDLENNKISSVYYDDMTYQPLLCFNAAYDRVYYLSYMGGFDLTLLTGYAGTPKNPYDLEFDDYYLDYYGYYSFYISVPNVTVEDNLMDTSCLYYQIFMDGDIMDFEWDPETDEYYGVPGVMTLVPYSFTNGNDFYTSGQTREIGIYSEGYDTLGAQMVYIYDGKITYSEIVTLNINNGQITTGVNAIDSQNVISTEYFDLQGRRISNPDNGIFVKRITLNDGSVVTRKVARR